MQNSRAYMKIHDVFEEGNESENPFLYQILLKILFFEKMGKNHFFGKKKCEKL